MTTRQVSGRASFSDKVGISESGCFLFKTNHVGALQYGSLTLAFPRIAQCCCQGLTGRVCGVLVLERSKLGA